MSPISSWVSIWGFNTIGIILYYMVSACLSCFPIGPKELMVLQISMALVKHLCYVHIPLPW